MKIHRLLSIMRKIFQQLVNKNFHEEFQKFVYPIIEATKGEVFFIWMLRSNGTSLFLYNTPGWEQELIDSIDEVRQQDISRIYYRYDRKKLVPIFENELRYLARKRLEVRNKKIQEV